MTEEEKQEIMDYIPDFTLFGMIDLEKSTSKENEEKRIVFGEISSTQKDEQNEILIQKSLDFSYFDEKGVIKYEHYPKNSPANIIGFPHERITDEDKTIIKGALLKNHKMADETWSLIRAIEQHNREFPEYQKTLGWSLEGNYGEKRRIGNGYVKGAKIYNVVITPNPVLKSTYLKMMEEHNTPILKSLCATPIETELTKKTGGDVITEDNIDENVKVTIDDGNVNTKKKKKSKNKKEAYVMKSFENYDEAIEYFVKKGYSKSDAKKIAQTLELEPEEDEDEDEERELKGIKKSLNDIKDWIQNLGKSTAKDSSSLEKDELNEDEDEDTYIVEDELEPEETEVDVTEFLKGINDNNNKILTTLEAQTEALEKTLGSLTDVVETLSERLETMEKSLDVEGHSVGEAIEVLMKSRNGISFTDIDKFKLATQDKGNGKFEFSELHNLLEKAVNANKITLSEQARAENAFRLRDNETLNGILAKCDN